MNVVLAQLRMFYAGLCLLSQVPDEVEGQSCVLHVLNRIYGRIRQ